MMDWRVTFRQKLSGPEELQYFPQRVVSELYLKMLDWSEFVLVYLMTPEKGINFVIFRDNIIEYQRIPYIDEYSEV